MEIFAWDVALHNFHLGTVARLLLLRSFRSETYGLDLSLESCRLGSLAWDFVPLGTSAGDLSLGELRSRTWGTPLTNTGEPWRRVPFALSLRCRRRSLLRKQSWGITFTLVFGSINTSIELLALTCTSTKTSSGECTRTLSQQTTCNLICAQAFVQSNPTYRRCWNT